MKKWFALAFVACLMAILVACGESTSNKPSNGPAPVLEVAEEDIATGSLEIIASNWKFDKEVYAIRAGEPINLTVNSIDGVHGIEIENSAYTSIGNQKETQVTITEPGTYTISCNIPCGQGHRTMKAKLVVVQ